MTRRLGTLLGVVVAAWFAVATYTILREIFYAAIDDVAWDDLDDANTDGGEL